MDAAPPSGGVPPAAVPSGPHFISKTKSFSEPSRTLESPGGVIKKYFSPGSPPTNQIKNGGGALGHPHLRRAAKVAAQAASAVMPGLSPRFHLLSKFTVCKSPSHPPVAPAPGWRAPHKTGPSCRLDRRKGISRKRRSQAGGPVAGCLGPAQVPWLPLYLCTHPGGKIPLLSHC